MGHRVGNFSSSEADTIVMIKKECMIKVIELKKVYFGEQCTVISNNIKLILKSQSNIFIRVKRPVM